MRNLVFSFLLIGFLSYANLVFAQITLPNPLAVSSFPALIANITTYVFTVVGGLAVLVFIWAGILFLTSAGNEGQLTKARKALIYAVIGLAIALAGEGLILLIRFILTGV